MLCFFRKLTLCLLTAFCVAKASAFSLLGPFESWQTAGIGYNPRGGELGGPHALGDEFRWVDGQITYGFDSSFVNYFGTEGIKQINAAMQIINSLPALSTITTNDLLNTAKYPLVAWRYNGTAQALNLRDLKSTALAYVLEGLGLAQPERFAWTLRSRSTSTVNLTNYLVFNRNFDPVTFKPTSYVNGERYSYRVREFSNPDFADAVEFIVDKAKPSFSSVAGGTFGSALSSSSLSLGSYYINLTRDDVGGLRYLYQRFNQNIEGQSSAGGTFLQVTNYDNVAVQTNYDLTLFGMRSLTNNAAALIGLYPGLVVTQTLSTVTPVVVIDQVYPDPAQVAWSAAGIFQPVVLKTNYLTINVPVYFHKYANVFTNLASRSSILNYRDVSRVKAPFSSGSNPTYVTNVVNNYVATNLASGSVNFVTRWLSDGSPDFSRYPIRMNDSGYYLTGSDIVKLPTLIQNLNQAGLNTPAGHVKARLSPTTLDALSQNLPSLTANLITDLNVLIDTTVFNADLVATLDLRPETYLLYIQGATGSEARRLNRMLLEDAFPGHLLRLLPSVPLVQRVTYTTNILYAAVNLFQGTTFRREQVLTFTNIEYAGFPITSVAVGNALRGGVDKLMLTNVVYNDLNPASFRFTNSYPIYTVTNGVSTVQTVERIQTQPDILFSAADLGTDGDGFTPITVARGSRWIDGTALNTSDPNKQAGSGPGEIGSGLVISFSKILPVHLNIFPGDITENTGANGSGFGSVVGIWGSYDGSTNAPTLYPKDITLDLLEKKLFR